MFTGIVHEVGTILSISDSSLRIATTAEAKLGDSIAVDGCCLTVTSLDDGLAFDLSPETFSRTIAGTYAVGSRVNIESSLRIGDRLGGHFVTGHIDAVGRVIGLAGDREFATLSIEIDRTDLVAEKGSISVNGVSLTVARWDRSKKIFEAALIPATLEMTNLKTLSEGSSVNIEYDLIARYLREMTQR